MSTVKFAINWRDASGNIVSDASDFAQPYINIEVSNPSQSKWVLVKALVDTGLGKTSIHRDIISALNCPHEGSVRVSGSAGWQTFDTYSMLYKFPSIPDVCAPSVFSAMDEPIGDGGILGAIGMDILRLGRLVLAPQNGLSFFELPAA
ncbi:hypothetical protein [Agrobacterium tumefaciens]|uniref:hypothetical protein n=1 Tax=Agrobacterium tumefaciens TaxID=358 RepID=UPI003B9FD708